MSAPPFLMLSDLTRQPDWRAAVTAQPRSVGLVLRDYDHHARAEMAAEMARLCHGQGRYFSIAGDARLAAKHGAAFHCPSHMLARLPLWRGPRRKFRTLFQLTPLAGGDWPKANDSEWSLELSTPVLASKLAGKG